MRLRWLQTKYRILCWLGFHDYWQKTIWTMNEKVNITDEIKICPRCGSTAYLSW